MTKFKIGDRVRYRLSDRSPYDCEMTVYNINYGMVYAKTPKGTKGGFRPDDLKLVEPVTRDSVTMTDEELADAYREGVKSQVRIRNELIDRGYTIKTESGPLKKRRPIELTITKLVEVTKTVTVTEEVSI